MCGDVETKENNFIRVVIKSKSGTQAILLRSIRKVQKEIGT